MDESGGGIVGHKHPPTYRFNAGQKAIYWIVVIGGGLVAATGCVADVPLLPVWNRRDEFALIVHSIVAMCSSAAVMLAHIYIGTVGMEGAFEAMGTGL